MTQADIDTGTHELLCSVRDGVALITLNRPAARNAMSDQLTKALRRMIKERGDDSSVGALLITGAGTAFCAGGDVKGMGDNSSKKSMSAKERIADLQLRQRLLTGALIAVKKPTIAALPGAAAGAGLAIALAEGPQLAPAAIKENLDLAAHIDFATALDHEAVRLVGCSASADRKEAVPAFVEKRKPKFVGA